MPVQSLDGDHYLGSVASLNPEIFESGVALAFASIVGIGDSIIAGSGASDSAHQWITIVGASLSAAVLNQGIGGTVLQNSNDSGGAPRANNGRDRFVADLLGASKREGCIIAYGFNDARYTAAPATFNVTNYGNDFREILDGLLIGGYEPSDIIIVAPYYITDTGLNTGSAGFTGQTRSGFEAFVDEAAACADDYGCYYVDMYDVMLNGGAASLISGDDIHPNDAGHAVIAAAVLEAQVVNTRDRPTNIDGTADGDEITVSLTQPSGTVSMEYGLIDSSYITVDTGTSGVFSSVDNGTYWIKARAIYTGSVAGPWAISGDSVTVNVSGSTVVFLNDTFTDTAGTEITSHTPESGGPWVVQTGNNPTSAPLIDSSGRMYSLHTQSVYRGSTPAPSADYYVEGVFSWLSNLTGDNVGIDCTICIKDHF